MTPVHEFLEMKKQAMSPEAKAALTMGGITAGTTALAAVGAGQLQRGATSAHDAVAKSIAFKKLMVNEPELQKMDGKKARRYFNTLYVTSPELAKDPFTASSWIKKMDEYEYVDPMTLKSLADAGSRIQKRYGQDVQTFQLAQGGVNEGIREYGRAGERKHQRHKLYADLGSKLVTSYMQGRPKGSPKNEQGPVYGY